MTPHSPVLPSQPDIPEVVYAKDQPEYQPLPAVRCDDGAVITRYRLTWRERLRVLWHGSIWLQQLTFGDRLQPQLPTVTAPTVRILEHHAEQSSQVH